MIVTHELVANSIVTQEMQNMTHNYSTLRTTLYSSITPDQYQRIDALNGIIREYLIKDSNGHSITTFTDRGHLQSHLVYDAEARRSTKVYTR